MHQNFYFLRQLTRELEPKIEGAVISECFSQSKDELLLRLEIGATPFFIRASLTPALSCLSFPGDFQRARKNSVDLFTDIAGTCVEGIRQFDNERSFALLLTENRQLLFKMHGNRTNIILFEDGTAKALFRKNMATDEEIRLETLDREIDWTKERFMTHDGDPRALYYTFGKVVWEYLAQRDFYAATKDEQWLLIQGVLQQLRDPTYYITYLKEKPTLSLIETGNVVKALTNPVEAANEFFQVFTYDYSLTREKQALLNSLRSSLLAAQNYCDKNEQKLKEISHDTHYKVWADLIMANLHTIRSGTEKVVVENLYDQKPIEIKLKKDLSPQMNAGVYYKKAKNQHIEVERLERSIREKKEHMEVVRRQIAEVEALTDLKKLRAVENRLNPSALRETAPLPYHEFVFRDFRILVGKNAQANDLLTFKHSYKDDLWLHAKDVTGSHVLVKHQAGRNFPKDVIEYAASLAAYNSKRRNESLCPVIVAPKKFVRRRKGDPPGAVVVEREEVILVTPWKG